jgi:hypothetical protein
MVRPCFLSYSEFFYSFPCLVVHNSVIYHCFPPATYIGPCFFFVPLFVPVQYLPSIFLDPLHHFLPLCIFHFVFAFSCSSCSYSPVEVPLPRVYDVPCFLSLRLRHVFLLSLSLFCILSLFSTIYCLYEHSFPCILLLLPLLVAFLQSPISPLFLFSR